MHNKYKIKTLRTIFIHILFFVIRFIYFFLGEKKNRKQHSVGHRMHMIPVNLVGTPYNCQGGKNYG